MLPTTTYESAGPPIAKEDAQPQCCLDVRILGPLRIRRGEEVLEAGDLGGPKPRQILEILLLNLGIPVSKERLIDFLWVGRPPAEAVPTLESYVSVLRRHLQPGQAKSGPLRTVTAGYVMDPALVELDLSRFSDLVRRASECGPAEALDLLREALDLASAPLLGDELTAPWAEEERGNHEYRACRARAQAAELALSLHQPGPAVRWAREALASDHLNEVAWSSLVIGLEESGQPLEALRAFEQCRRTLHREMGCTPGDALRAAHARLLQLTGGATAPAAPAAASTAMPTAAMPAAATSDPLSATDVADIQASTVLATLRILTIDDHRTFAELLTGALDREPDLRSVGAAASVESGVQLCRELLPDVVVMDYHLPDGDGLSAAARILEHNPDTRIIMLTGDPSQDVLRRAAAIGICGFLPKDGSLATMLDTLRHARAGNMVVHPSLVAQIGELHYAPTTFAPRPVLSPRELDVLRLMSEGHKVRAVADELNISIHACRGYVRSIFSKLGSRSQREAAPEADVGGVLRLNSDVQAC